MCLYHIYLSVLVSLRRTGEDDISMQFDSRDVVLLNFQNNIKDVALKSPTC